MLGLNIAYLCTKFDQSRIGRFIDMVGAHQILYGSRDVTSPFSGMVCRPRADTL